MKFNILRKQNVMDGRTHARTTWNSIQFAGYKYGAYTYFYSIYMYRYEILPGDRTKRRQVKRRKNARQQKKRNNVMRNNAKHKEKNNARRKEANLKDVITPAKKKTEITPGEKTSIFQSISRRTQNKLQHQLMLICSWAHRAST